MSIIDRSQVLYDLAMQLRQIGRMQISRILDAKVLLSVKWLGQFRPKGIKGFIWLVKRFVRIWRGHAA
jgi:hypothetical protein